MYLWQFAFLPCRSVARMLMVSQLRMRLGQTKNGRQRVPAKSSGLRPSFLLPFYPLWCCIPPFRGNLAASVKVDVSVASMAFRSATSAWKEDFHHLPHSPERPSVVQRGFALKVPWFPKKHQVDKLRVLQTQLPPRPIGSNSGREAVWCKVRGSLHASRLRRVASTQ